MSTDTEPFEGCWYETDEGDRFLVVTYDEEEGLIEIQHEDGRVEELGLDAWDEGEFSVIDQPEDDVSFAGTAELGDDDEGWRQAEDEEEDWEEPLADNEG